jgi:hypothetical protein
MDNVMRMSEAVKSISYLKANAAKMIEEIKKLMLLLKMVKQK